jgi:MFS transporter, DHA1 family, multidrug resistance protein
MGTYLMELKLLPKEAKAFIATEMLLGIGLGIVALLLNLHLLSIGYNEADAGRIASYGSLLQGLLSLPAGLLASRFGRKKMLVAGLAMLALGVCGYGTAAGLPGIYVSQTLWAVGITLIVTTEIQLLFQYCRDRKRESQAYGLLFAIFTLFSGIGTLIGGFLPNWIGTASFPYKSTLYVGAAAIALCCLLRGILLPSRFCRVPDAGNMETVNDEADRSGGDDQISASDRLGQARAFIRLALCKLQLNRPSRSVILLSMIILMGGLMFGLLVPFHNLLIKFRFDWGDGSVSLLLTITSVLHFAGSIYAPYLREKIGAFRTYAILFAGNIVSLFLMAMALPAGAFAALFILRGGMGTMLNNMIESESMSAVPENERNLFAAFRSVFRSVGGAVAAYTTGFILSLHDYLLPFLCAGAVMTVMYGYFLWRVIGVFRQKEAEELQA